LIVEPVHILAWGPGRWHVHSEPSGGVDEGEDIGSSDRAFVVSLSSFVRIAALHHTNCPGSFSERQMNQDSLMKGLLGDKNMQEKTRSCRVPGAEPCVLTCLFLLVFPKLHFCVLFEKNLQPGWHFTGPRRDQIEPERPQKHKVLSQKPVFTMSGGSSKIGVFFDAKTFTISSAPASWAFARHLTVEVKDLELSFQSWQLAKLL
jgi:hypothetical protein